MKNPAVFKTVIIISLFILFALTLSGGFGYYAPRSLKELWNLGHIFLFAAFIRPAFRFPASGGGVQPWRRCYKGHHVLDLHKGHSNDERYEADIFLSWSGTQVDFRFRGRPAAHCGKCRQVHHASPALRHQLYYNRGPDSYPYLLGFRFCFCCYLWSSTGPTPKVRGAFFAFAHSRRHFL